MIKFFRTIRQRMLKENRFSRYFLYAIGEIVLVVIGILIALNVNNWNAERRSRAQERALLQEMHGNLAMDLADCKFNIEHNDQLRSSNLAVLRQLNERIPFTDTMRFHYGNIWGGTILTTNTSAYDNLKSIGFDLISSDSLRRSITQLYSERYKYLGQLEIDMDGSIQVNQVTPQISAKVVLDTVFVSGHPVDATALMDDVAFHGMLRMNVVMRDFMLMRYQGVERRIMALIEMIDRELEARR
ncbi:MAG: hypothetical protein IPM46_14900 [Flavobacteriales bacterium]|nr:hypothetical protein [Flavobacteriales bacterium]